MMKQRKIRGSSGSTCACSCTLCGHPFSLSTLEMQQNLLSTWKIILSNQNKTTAELENTSYFLQSYLMLVYFTILMLRNLMDICAYSWCVFKYSTKSSSTHGKQQSPTKNSHWNSLRIKRNSSLIVVVIRKIMKNLHTVLYMKKLNNRLWWQICQ